MSKPQAQVRSALKFDLFADAARKRKIQTLGDPLQVIAQHIDFDHLTQVIDELLPRGQATKGGRPPYPTAVMVRILILKYLYNLSDEQMEYQLLDRMSYQRFCLLTDSANVPDRNTLWHYQQRLGVDGVTALFEGVDAQLLQRGFMARCGQIIDATLVPAPIEHLTQQDKAQLEQGNIPANWSEAKRRQKDLDIKERGMPASDKCVRHGGKNALEAANLLKKRENPPIPNGLGRDGAENRGFRGSLLFTGAQVDLGITKRRVYQLV